MLTITHPGLIADLHFLYCDAYQDGSHNFIMNDGLCTLRMCTPIFGTFILSDIELRLMMPIKAIIHLQKLQTTNYTRFMGHIIKCSV